MTGRGRGPSSYDPLMSRRVPSVSPFLRWNVPMMIALSGVVAACGGGSGDGAATATSVTSDTTASTEAKVPEEARGLITNIEREAGEIRAFTVKTDDGETYRIELDDRDYGFDLNHLQEHLDQRLPVTVALEDVDGRAVARSVED